MGVDINEARGQAQALAVNHIIGQGLQFGADAGDAIALNQHICDVGCSASAVDHLGSPHEGTCHD